MSDTAVWFIPHLNRKDAEARIKKGVSCFRLLHALNEEDVVSSLYTSC